MTATNNNTRTLTLDAFLAEYTACRLWWCGVGAPTGTELVVNTDTDCDEDYCDSQSLIECIPNGCGNLDGTVTQDRDGEWRWDVDSLQGVTDNRGNTIYNLVAWGE